jgi:hypothetical protein
MKSLKDWLNEMVCKMKPETIKAITENHHFLNTLRTTFNSSIGIKPNTNEKKVALNLAPLLYCSFIILFSLNFSYLKIILEVP